MATVNIGRLKFKWQGNYSSGTAYVVDDVVYHGGNSYVCINDSTGNAPTNTSYWQKMAQGSDLGSLSGIAQGDVVYYNGTDWTRLAAGTSGQFLKTNGSGGNPVWDDVDLGTAAALDVGTGANNVVQLDSSGNLPAINGAALTGIDAGGIELLGSYTVSSSASSHDIITGLDLSTYHRVTIAATGVQGDTAGADVYMGLLNAVGSFAAFYYNQDGIMNTTFSQSNSLGFRANGGGMVAGSPLYFGEWDLFGLRNGEQTHCISKCLYYNSSNLYSYYHGGGSNNNTYAVTGFRASVQTGNITAGKFYIMGHKNS